MLGSRYIQNPIAYSSNCYFLKTEIYVKEIFFQYLVGGKFIIQVEASKLLHPQLSILKLKFCGNPRNRRTVFVVAQLLEVFANHSNDMCQSGDVASLIVLF